MRPYIRSFKTLLKKYDGWTWFTRNNCSNEVLEWFISNYDMNDDDIWGCLSTFQPLTQSFIEKYKDKLDWYCIIDNTNINLTYDFMEKHLYQCNLYMVYHNIRKSWVIEDTKIKEIYKKYGNDSYIKDEYGIIFKKLAKRYQWKYQIDKITYEINR